MLVERWRARGGEVAVVGLGRSGLAATHLLRDRGLAVYASDGGRGERLEAQAAELRARGAAVDVGGHDLARIRAATAVVCSPGVPPDAAPRAAAALAGREVVGELDLGIAELPRTRAVAITGTNGKTTTTTIVAHVLRGLGLDAEAAGNIGLPVCEVARRAAPPAWLALEVSSFQLHDAPHLDPAIGVLTNLAPNHLDRYPTLASYYADKALLFRHARPGSTWVTNADNADVVAMVREVAGRHRRFSTEGRAEGWYDRAGRRLMLGDVPVMPRDEFPLLGDHNVANALAAVLVGAELGGAPAAIAAALRTVTPIAHRVEPIREAGGVLWINDSKSTNVTSTVVAIASLERPFVLLLGGRHKGEPYTRLGPLLAPRCRAVVAYGEAGPLVEADLAGQVPVVRAGDFAEVLATARGLARPGDAVLLSPACSSYDMFDNYEQRGEAFRAAVAALP